MLILNTSNNFVIFKQKRYKTLLNVAVSPGMWQNAEDIICDDKDREYLRKIRKEYKNL